VTRKTKTKRKRTRCGLAGREDFVLSSPFAVFFFFFLPILPVLAMSKDDKKQARSSGKEKTSADVAESDHRSKNGPKHPVLRYGLTVLLVMCGFYGLYW